MNTVNFFSVDRMAVTNIRVTFLPNNALNYSQIGKKLSSFHYTGITKKTFSVVDCLKEYLKCRSTKVQTDTKALFKTYGKHFRGSIFSWKLLFWKNTHHTSADQLLSAKQVN